MAVRFSGCQLLGILVRTTEKKHVIGSSRLKGLANKLVESDGEADAKPEKNGHHRCQKKTLTAVNRTTT